MTHIRGRVRDLEDDFLTAVAARNPRQHPSLGSCVPTSRNETGRRNASTTR